MAVGQDRRQQWMFYLCYILVDMPGRARSSLTSYKEWEIAHKYVGTTCISNLH